MSRLLFTTEDMRAVAAQMESAAGVMLERIPSLLPAGVVMPPALELEAAEAVARVSADLTASSAFYGANAVDLMARAALVEAENAGAGVIADISAFERLVTSRLVSDFFTTEGFVDAFRSEAQRVAEGLVERDVQRFIEDPVDELLSDGRMASAGRDFTMYRDLEWVEHSPLGRVLVGVAVVSDAQGLVSDESDVLSDTSGDDVAGRAVAMGVTGGADTFFDVMDFAIPGFGIIDGLTGGTIRGVWKADAEFLGGGVSGAVEGYKRHGLVGAVTGFGSGTMQAGADWRDKAEHGHGWSHALVKSEDWVINL